MIHFPRAQTLRRGRGPSSLQAILALALLIVSTASLIVVTDPPTASAQSRQEQIDELRRKIDEASSKQQAEQDQIDASDARLNEAEALIHQLEDQVAAATQRVAEAQRELDVATAKLKEAESRLAEVEASLRGVRQHIDRRAVALYKSGKTSGAALLVGSDSLQEAELNVAYERNIQRRDQQEADRLVALGKDAEEVRHELDLARVAVEERRSAYANEKKALEASLADQKKVRDALNREIENHKKILLAIESDLSKFESSLNAMEGYANRATGGLSRGSGNGKLVWPASGGVVSPFGMRFHPILHYSRLHAGVDIGAGYGSPVIAAAAGVVTTAGPGGGYGNMIVIDHGDGLATAYAHLSYIGVSVGQTVSQRQEIGNVGCTGLCSGPHLHFETRVNGSPVDPLNYFPQAR